MLRFAIKSLPTKEFADRRATERKRDGKDAAMQETGDADLIRRAAKGDQLAMRTIYARHHVKVVRFLMRMTGDQALSEELCNDAFMDVWHQADRFEFRSAVSTWILGIARYKALNALRRVRRTVDIDDEADRLADDTDTPEVSAQKRSKAELLRACVDALSDVQREVIDLAYYHEKTIAEISELLEVPENTVKTRMFQARKSLSKLMAERGVDRGWP